MRRWGICQGEWQGTIEVLDFEWEKSEGRAEMNIIGLELNFQDKCGWIVLYMNRNSKAEKPVDR